MAIHASHKSMIKESLPEFLAVARYCVEFKKDREIWGSEGCYGYPANALLLAIADAIGSYVIGGKTRAHFDILNHPDYYNLGLSTDNITTIYEAYRCLGTHNLVIGKDMVLDIGNDKDPVFSIMDGGAGLLRLRPFLNLTTTVVEKFLKDADTLVPEEVKKV